MKKILVAAAALVWAGSASAQVVAAGSQHHAPAGLSCSECHVMHASRSHTYSGAVSTADTRYNQGTGHPKLLVADGTNATCLACHDAPGTNTDVFKSTTSTLLNLRSGGALNGAVAGHEDNTVYQDWQGHTLGSQATPPGWDTANGTYSAGTEGFNCSLCHAVHGGAADAFRNLGGSRYMGPAPLFAAATNPFVTNYPTFSTTGNTFPAIDATADVTYYASGFRPPGVSSSKDARNVAYGVGSANTNGTNGMNRYCAVCHGNFHNSGMTDAAGDYLKHPTTGSPDIVARMTTNVSQFGVTRPVFTANDKTAGEVGCLTCHKAHGNKRAYGLIWPANGVAESATTNYEDGDGTNYQSLCKTCHPQARTAGLP